MINSILSPQRCADAKANIAKIETMKTFMTELKWDIKISKIYGLIAVPEKNGVSPSYIIV